MSQFHPLLVTGDRSGRQVGFTLIEMMIVVAIIGILAAIAYPAYLSHVTKANRVAAEGCLSQFSSYMERYYATYLRYDQAGNASDAAKNTRPMLDCMSSQQTGKFYTYDFNGSPGATTYELIATPTGAQQRRDTLCGTLHLNQAGQRDADSPGCW